MVDFPQSPLMIDGTLPRPRTTGEPLAEGYYLDNFETVLETVVERYDDLLSVPERAFAKDFARLGLDARRLYVRLILRKGPVFRRDRLAYAEIGDLDGAVETLIERGFMDDAPDVPVEDLLNLLLRDELQTLASELLPDTSVSGWRKADLVSAIGDRLGEDAPRHSLGPERPGRPWRFVRPLHQDVLLLFRLLFFGNLSQDFSTFVLHDLGVMRFEAYELRRDLRLFPTRKSVDDTFFLRLALEWTHEALESADLEALQAIGRSVRDRREPWDPAAHKYRDRVLNRVARALERAGDLDGALEFYAPAARPPSRERRARILERLDRCAEALDLCAEIEAGPRDETERFFAPRFAHGLRRRLGKTASPWRRTRRPVRELTVDPRPGVSVESLALNVLVERGQPGFFAENWLWKSLFGLHFWDVIFAPLPGAFQHPFQFGPLDLHSADFFLGRRSEIELRLREIRAGEWTRERLLAIYETKRETANAFVAWHDGLSLWPSLELALKHVPADRLAWVFERMARDPGRYRRGLPDLFVLRDKDPGFELLEVKGPGDQLRPEQKSWIDYLNRGDVPAVVLKVRFAE